MPHPQLAEVSSLTVRIPLRRIEEYIDRRPHLPPSIENPSDWEAREGHTAKPAQPSPALTSHSDLSSTSLTYAWAKNSGLHMRFEADGKAAFQPDQFDWTEQAASGFLRSIPATPRYRTLPKPLLLPLARPVKWSVRTGIGLNWIGLARIIRSLYRTGQIKTGPGKVQSSRATASVAIDIPRRRRARALARCCGRSVRFNSGSWSAAYTSVNQLQP